MDTRFSKINWIKFPLYKSRLSFRSHLFKIDYRSETLKKYIANHFGVDKSNVILLGSCSEAITHILQYHKRIDKISEVYIPDYSCTEVIDSVLSSGCVPVLYDIDADLNPDKNILEKVSSRDDIVFILPSFFGVNKTTKEFKEYFNSRKYIVIYDEAQSFPMTTRYFGCNTQRVYSVVSFGVSKPISACGGGGLISHFNSGIINDLLKKNNEKLLSEFLSCLYSVIIEKIRIFPFLRNFVDNHIVKRKQYDSLEKLQKNMKIEKIIPTEISVYKERLAYQRVLEYRKWSTNSKVLFERKELIREIENQFGKDSLCLLKDDICKQGVVTVFLDSSERYKVASKLAKIGIQNTIYYLPVSSIMRYNNNYKYPLQKNNSTFTDKLIDSILIIPCNLDYNHKEISKLAKAIGEIR